MTNVQITPKQAFGFVAGLLPSIPGLGRAVITGKDLEEFEWAIETITSTVSAEPTGKGCLMIERRLGLIFNLFEASPRFNAKPKEQRNLVIETIAKGGVMCNEAGRRLTLVSSH